jgi:hypothetical protein
VARAGERDLSDRAAVLNEVVATGFAVTGFLDVLRADDCAEARLA